MGMSYVSIANGGESRQSQGPATAITTSEQRGVGIDGLDEVDIEAWRRGAQAAIGTGLAHRSSESPLSVPASRPEQQKTPHDTSDVFSGSNAPPSSPIFEKQPDKGQGLGFDFARNPCNAKRPLQTFDEIMKADVAEKASVM